MRQATLPLLTQDWLDARTVPDGEHRIWTGYSQRGHPKANMLVEGEWRPVNVRRAVWLMHKGAQPRADRMIKNGCGVFNCVAPGCLEARPWGDRSRGSKLPQHVLHRVATMKRRTAKVPHEDVPDIIASAEWLSSGVLMEVYGVSRETINAIRRLELHREYSNPFMRLLA